MGVSRNRLFIVAAAVLLIVLIPILLDRPYTLKTIDDQSEFSWCAERVFTGQIFQGEPYCGQGVMTYVSLQLVNFLGGGSFNTYIYIALFILLNLHMLYCIHRIVRKETGKDEYLLITAIYAILVFLWSHNFSSFLSMYYTFIGFAITFCFSFKHNRIIGPAIMTLGPLTKATAMPMFAILFFYTLYRSFNPRLEEGKFKINLNKQAFVPLVVIAAVFAIVFLVLWPNAYAYEFGLQGSRVNLPWREIPGMIADQFTFNSGTILFSLFFLLSLIAFAFTKDFYSGASALFFIALFMILFRQTGLGSDNGLMFAINRIDYYLPSYPFFIVAMAKLKKKLSDRKVKITCGIILALFLATATEFTVAEHDVQHLEEHFMEATSLIPVRDDDVVLTEDPNSGNYIIDRYYDKDIKLDIIPHDKVWKEGHFPDGNFLNQLVFLNMTKQEDWMIPPDEEEYKRLYARLFNRDYSIIFVNTPQRIIISQMLLAVQREDPDLLQSYCSVRIPDLQFHTPGGSHQNLLYFNESERCVVIWGRLGKYFKESYDDICSRSPNAANQIVKRHIEEQGIMTLPECTRKPDSLLYVTRQKYHFRILSLGLALLIIIFAWVGSVPRVRFSKPEGRQETSKTAESRSP